MSDPMTTAHIVFFVWYLVTYVMFFPVGAGLLFKFLKWLMIQ